MFEDLSSLVKGIVNQIGLSFFLSGVVPLLVGISVNQYVIFTPAMAGPGAGWNLFPQVDSPWLGLLSDQMLTTLVLAFGAALALVPLNLFVTRLFEGLLPGMKALLYPLYALKRARHRRLYAAIEAARIERRELLAEYEDTGEFDADADFAIQERLHLLHAQREAVEPMQSLPYELRRLTPTSYGNAWAVMEEYPFNRYGMDGMFFWPYMRTILLEHNPPLLSQIDNQKLLGDITTNMTFVAGVLAVEGVVFGIAWGRSELFALTAVSLLAFWLFYRASVQLVRAMGTLVGQSYDLYRYHLLDAFGLARPDDLDEEYWVWVRLSAFLRRGEPFYFDILRHGLDDEEDAPGRHD